MRGIVILIKSRVALKLRLLWLITKVVAVASMMSVRGKKRGKERESPAGKRAGIVR
jgi:hypothetical protein